MARDPEARYPSARAFAEALTGTTSSSPRESPRASERSLVVLPFVNQSPDPDNEYFSDGLTEEIISDLAAIRSLRVISRTSSMQLKGTTKDIPTISRELGVRYVMEGSVRKAGNALRITAQLIDATTDARIWGEKYGGTLDDVFELQERVAREIVAALGITLTSEEDRHLAQRPIEDARAFELYLQARQEVQRYNVASIERAEKLARQAIAIVGEAAPLQALLAWCKVSLVRAGLAPDRSGLDEAKAVAEGLVQRAPDAPYGHALLGFISYELGAMPEAIRHLHEALKREPNDADALFFLGICLIACGDIPAGERVAQRLLASDPLSPLAWELLGVMPWWSGRAASSLVAMERAAALDPSSMIIQWGLGYARALVGDVTGAATAARKLLTEAPTMPYTAQLVSLAHAMQGRRAEALAALQGVQGLDAHHKFHLSESFSMAGDTERALALLDEAVETGFHPGDFIARHCPFLEPLRGTPRFEAIAAKATRRTQDFLASEASAGEWTR
jgi:serine/threonine-protein kinase